MCEMTRDQHQADIKASARDRFMAAIKDVYAHGHGPAVTAHAVTEYIKIVQALDGIDLGAEFAWCRRVNERGAVDGAKEGEQ